MTNFSKLIRRPSKPVTLPTVPRTTTAPAAVMPEGINLKGRRKCWFFIGRGHTGKTTACRFIAEMMRDRGGQAVIAAMDPTNRSLRLFLDDVAEPPGTKPEDVREWARAMIQFLMDDQLNAIVDLGGGNTVIGDLMEEMPDLPSILSGAGIEPIAVYMVSPDPDDLVPLQDMEALGFQPAATAIVMNLGRSNGARDRFDDIKAQPAFVTAVERGAVPLWMPALSDHATRWLRENQSRYMDAATNGPPFVASAVRSWLDRMAQEFAPVMSWIPE